MELPLIKLITRSAAVGMGILLALFLSTVGPDYIALLEGKVNREDPIFTRTVLEYEHNADGSVTYDYRAAALPPLLDSKEDPTLRTEYSYTKYLGTNEQGEGVYELIAYTDKTYAREDGQWFARETATTDRATFAAARQRDPIAGLFWERAVAVDYYAGAGDGYTLGDDVQNCSGFMCCDQAVNWATALDQVTADFSDYTSTNSDLINAGDAIYDPELTTTTCSAGIRRVFLPFNTSAIPAGATISAATLSVYVTTAVNEVNDGFDYVTVVRTSQATHTSLVDDDYDQCGAITNPTEGIDSGQRKDISTISANAYLAFTLNGTGRGWIAKNGQSSTCSATAGITCIGLRQGHDTTNNLIFGGANTVTLSMSEQTGTSQDPYLSVTYTGGTSALTRPPNNLGLTGYWNFNEATSTIATDFSGRGNTGTLINTPVWVPGKLGFALSFNGSNTRVDTPATLANLVSASTATISVWVKPTGTAPVVADAADGQTIVADDDNGSTGGTGGFLGIARANVGGNDRIYVQNWDGNYDAVGVTYTPDEWIHVVLVHAGGNLTVYKNGVPSGTVASGNTSVLVAQFRIGGGYGTNFNGIIDEVRTYNRALSDAEISALYGSGAIRLGANTRTLQAGSTLINGLVGHWTFDGIDTLWSSQVAGTAIDATGNNRNGTFVGNINRTTSVAIGKIGQALSFDGAPASNPDGQYVSVADAAAFDITGDITLAAWVRPRALNNVDGIITKNDNLTWSYEFYLNGSNQIGFDVNGTNAGNSTGTIPDTNWNHVAVTRSGSTITFYINGAAAGTATNGTAFNVSTAPVSIGTFSVESPCGSGCFDGSIDDPRIYNRALTASEIQQLYRLGQVRISQ